MGVEEVWKGNTTKGDGKEPTSFTVKYDSFFGPSGFDAKSEGINVFHVCQSTTDFFGEKYPIVAGIPRIKVWPVQYIGTEKIISVPGQSRKALLSVFGRPVTFVQMQVKRYDEAVLEPGQRYALLNAVYGKFGYSAGHLCQYVPFPLFHKLMQTSAQELQKLWEVTESGELPHGEVTEEQDM